MVSGEMGRSIWSHPLSYLKLMAKYRGSLAEGKHHGTVKIGVALHWNKVGARRSPRARRRPPGCVCSGWAAE